MGITNFDRIELDGEEIFSVISTPVNKTVGVGKDFELFHDAMAWACSRQTINGAKITLTLDAGTHFVGTPDQFNFDVWTFYEVESRIAIKGATGLKTDVIITLPPDDDGNNWPYMFDISPAGDLTLEDITIEGDAGGYPYPDNYANFAVSGGRLSFFSSTVKGGWAGIEVYTNGYAYIYTKAGVGGTLIEGTDYGIYNVMGKILINSHTTDTTIQNCAVGIGSVQGAMTQLSAYSGGALALSGNTADYDHPVNEIQYDGSYITNNTAALSFKA